MAKERNFYAIAIVLAMVAIIGNTAWNQSSSYTTEERPLLVADYQP